MLRGMDINHFIKILYERARIDVRSLKLPEHVKIPEYILEELEFADARKAKDLIVYREEEKKKKVYKTCLKTKFLSKKTPTFDQAWTNVK